MYQHTSSYKKFHQIATYLLPILIGNLERTFETIYWTQTQQPFRNCNKATQKRADILDKKVVNRQERPALDGQSN